MIKSFRRLTAFLADGACCHLINFINWRLSDRTNSPADLANYMARCESLSRQEFRFQGVIKTEATAAIIPPVRQLMWLGATLEKSKAGYKVSYDVDADRGDGERHGPYHDRKG